MDHALCKGTVIGGVTILDVLGQGGFGITYLARDNRSGRRYALKEYFPVELARRAPDCRVLARTDRAEAYKLGREAFYREASTLQSLPRQRGLVKVRGAFEKFSTVYCLMELIDGEPLDRMMRRYERDGRPVPEDLLVDFIQAIASALSAVHRKGLIHRDIKPANIMIRRSDGQPVLIDFGACRHFDRGTDITAIFTREYAPIEQLPLDWSRLRRPLREGPWTDLFSFSVLLYRMITRRLPKDAHVRLRGLQCKGRDPYQPVASALLEVPSAERYSGRLTELIDYGCQLLPADRPADAAAFAELLEPGRPPEPERLRFHPHFGAAEPISDLQGLGEAAQSAHGLVPAAGRGDVSSPAAAGRPGRGLRLLVLVAILIALAALFFVVTGGGPAMRVLT